MEEPSVGRWRSSNTSASTATKNTSWTRQKREKYVVLPSLEPNYTDNDASIQLTNAYLPYKKDAYGCHSTLVSKRTTRNSFLRFHPYWASAKELRGLLEWCPDGRLRKPKPRPWWKFGSENGRGGGDRDSDWDLIYPGRLPWDH